MALCHITVVKINVATWPVSDFINEVNKANLETTAL
jgi:hypothetical protein